MRIQESFLPSFPFIHLLRHWVRQPFLGIPPFISDPGSLCLFFILIFCESLAYILTINNYPALYLLFRLLDELSLVTCSVSSEGLVPESPCAELLVDESFLTDIRRVALVKLIGINLKKEEGLTF